jgi:chromosomal replication initiator protein
MQAWQQFIQRQESELGLETSQKWLRSLKIERFDACNLYLEAKDSFQALWFEEHIRSKAQAELVNGNNKKIKIHISIANTPPPQKKTGKEKIIRTSEEPFQLNFDEMDPLCTFDNFIVNEDNALAYKLLKEAAAPSSSNEKIAATETFNPIYIHGGGGSGKTHLLMSVANAFKANGLKTMYIRAETFTSHVVYAIRSGEMSIFRQAYRNIDVLLVDDVHIFSRKGATQEEFFHTFNTLHLEGKQIILSANCSPPELQLIEPRLISRFEWGIVLSLKTLQGAERRQILNVKANAFNFNLPVKIADFLSETFSGNPKALTKALEALILRIHLDSPQATATLTVPSVASLLADLIIEEQKSALTPPKIIQGVAEHFGIKSEDILGKAQTRDCSLPRQLAMFLCRQHLKLPFMKIGDLFSRDHSTVMTGIKHIQKAIDSNDKETVSNYYTVLKKLEN